MNSCDISEEETTNALRALYLVPAPENSASLNVHHDVVSTNVPWASGVHLGQNLEPGFPNVPTVAKKKSGLKCDLDLPHSTSSQFSNSVKKDQQTSVKFRSSNDANEYPPFELNSSNKGVPGDASRSSDFNAEKQKPKQKDKHKKRGSNSDGGTILLTILCRLQEQTLSLSYLSLVFQVIIVEKLKNIQNQKAREKLIKMILEHLRNLRKKACNILAKIVLSMM